MLRAVGRFAWRAASFSTKAGGWRPMFLTSAKLAEGSELAAVHEGLLPST